MKFYSRDCMINTVYRLLVNNNKGEGRVAYLFSFSEKWGLFEGINGAFAYMYCISLSVA